MKFLVMVVSDIFLVSLFLYLAAVRIDLSLEGLISRAFNLTILLIVCIIAGAGAIVLPSNNKADEVQNAPVRFWMYSALLSVMVGSIIGEILKPLSPWALLMGAAGGFIVFLASLAMMNDNQT